MSGWGRNTWGSGLWGENVPVTVNLGGWGRGPWGQGAWGESLGLVATGAVGSVTVKEGVGVFPTGVSAEASTLNNGSEFTADGAAQLSTAQAKFGSASLLLDGTDDFVTSDDNIDLSSGDFTVDLWIRPTSVTGYKGIWQTGTSKTEQSYLLGNQVYWVVNPSTIISSSVTVSAGVWTMLSYEREGNVHRIYKNGTLEDTFTTANKPDNGVFSVGKNGFGDFNGYIDEVRLSSVARYEGTSFTEPVAEYGVDSDTTALLHFDGANGSTDIINETAGNVSVEADANVNATGLEATSELGTVGVEADAIVAVTGVQGTTALGIAGPVTTVDVAVTGVQGTTALGSPTVTGIATVNVTGVQGTTALGTATVDLQQRVLVTGVQGTTALGETTEIGTAKVYPIGVQATGQVGNVLVWGQIVPDQDANWTEIAA